MSKRKKYVKTKDLVVGKMYVRCHGHHFPVELLVYDGHRKGGFGCDYHFKSLSYDKRSKDTVSLGKDELMLFENLADAVAYTRECASRDFEEREVENLKEKYIRERVGFALSDIPNENLDKVFKGSLGY
jgi:hypothetical protein